MKTKKILTVILALIISISFTTEAEATSGRLSKSTIEKCGQTYYGKHSNHYHKAKKSGKYWYAKSTSTTYKKVARCKYVKTKSKAKQKKTKNTVTSTKLIKVKLKKCTDGDTAQFTKVGKSRFLMIDTPERYTKYGKKASKYTCTILKKAKKIQVKYDSKASKKDRYQRSLVWVFVDGKLLQSKIATKGYVKKYYTSQGRATKNYKKIKLNSKYVNQVRKSIKKKNHIWY
ncbi:thermonuclease family protein [Mycoplasma sp. P36-A1]|uniref:thermonuclease family protein n=1 Tax=Mycoplasma sp. P36-A1 TaxID=3252900 RepID=UPI003C2D3FAE